MSQSDLRLYARFECIECAILYSSEREEPHRTTLMDIGLGGVQLRSKESLPVDVKLILHIGQNVGPILKLTGKVLYCNPAGSDGMHASGFKFTPESHEERVTIAEFVHEVFQKQWEILAS
jgi:hypothetical protein